MNAPAAPSTLDLTGELHTGRLVIEASAGTGKTYSLSALVVRHIAERDRQVSELLLVTFTRAAAAELRDRTRRVLVAASNALHEGVVVAEHGWMHVLLDGSDDEVAERRRRVDAAIRAFDEATITTIHGFCQIALRQLGLRSGNAVDTELGANQTQYVEEVCRDLVVQALHRDIGALSWSDGKGLVPPSTVLAQLEKSVRAVLGNRGVRLVPMLGASEAHPDDRPERLSAWVDLVHRAVALVGERQRARQEMGYDELITGLYDAVHHPVTGAAAVATLRSRYKLVMVDEFQDTDAVQWGTFATIFDGDLITVGDPKQAIYRFRGADVHAYLEAVREAPTVRLDTNYRSDAALVDATNRLIEGVHLGNHRIVAAPVGSPPGKVATSLDAGPPLAIRRVPEHPLLAGPNTPITSAKAEVAVIDDVVRQSVTLLEHHHLTIDGAARRLHPGDIAVLVRSNDQAEAVVDAFVEAGVPAVRARTGSVLLSPAVEQLRRLLAALEQPSNAAMVRLAALGDFFRCQPVDLDPMADDPEHAAAVEERIGELQRRCARWADLLTRVPFLAWFDRVCSESALAPALLGRMTGERVLTDLGHLVELLSSELGGGSTTAAAAQRALDRLVSAADDRDPGPQMRRIDSDARAVQVSTVHGSKGLEYPVVLLPFGWKGAGGGPPYEYHLPTGERTIDIASDQGWTCDDPDEQPEGRRHHAQVEAIGDDLRLLYVALTRARHRTVVWWVPYSKGGTSALSKVLFDRDASGDPRNTEPDLSMVDDDIVSFIPDHRPADPAATAEFEVLVGRAVVDGVPLMSVDIVDVEAPTARWVAPAPESAPPALELADARGRGPLADPSWRRWSFTGITRDRHDAWVPSMPQSGGTDEPDESDDGDPAPTVATMPWAATGGGKEFGTLVHEVLERVDPTSPTLEADLTELVWARSGGGHRGAAPRDVVAGLVAAIATPMGPIADGRSLGEIPVRDRLAELDFDMPLCPGANVAAPQLGEVLLRTLPDGDPQRAYAQLLAEGRFDIDLRGHLGGSIDAVLRLGDGAQQRYVVVDYKTNRLHPRGAEAPLEWYHPDRLPAAMAEADYPLQSILYSVALHRMLRWRLGDGYDPDVHLGGIAYLFLRGMVGPATPVDEAGCPAGVFAWRPPAATVVALDRLLASGVVS